MSIISDNLEFVFELIELQKQLDEFINNRTEDEGSFEPKNLILSDSELKDTILQIDKLLIELSVASRKGLSGEDVTLEALNLINDIYEKLNIIKN